MSVTLRVACVGLGEPRTLVGKLVKTTTHQEDLRMLTTPSTQRCKVLSLKSTLSSDSPVFVCSSFISCPVRQQRMRIWKFTWTHQKIAPCCFIYAVTMETSGYKHRFHCKNLWCQRSIKNWYVLLYNLTPFVERRSHLTSCCSVVIHIWKTWARNHSITDAVSAAVDDIKLTSTFYISFSFSLQGPRSGRGW